MGQRGTMAVDGFIMRSTHLGRIVHEQELAEMVADGGRFQVIGGG